MSSNEKQTEKRIIKVSVRGLVEFLLRSGDIDGSRGGWADRRAMLAGGRVHRKLQKKRGTGYQPEVPLRYEKEYENFTLVIEGRADGILTEYQDDADGNPAERKNAADRNPAARQDSGGAILTSPREGTDGTGGKNSRKSGEKVKKGKKGKQGKKEKQEKREKRTPSKVTIEEIKGVYADVSKMEEPVPVHLAQAKCYAFITASQQNLPEISVCMTYVNLETEHIRRFSESYTQEELDLWFSDLLDSCRKWIEFRVRWDGLRDESMKDLEFPFAYRKGQRELTADVYRTILRRKQLFVEAPTGTGKTMSVLFPAVRALGEGVAVKIFYLTARTVTGTVAQEALHILRSCGLSCKSLSLTAKEKICPLEVCDCRPAACPRAKGHFDRVNEALYEMITEQDDFSREAVLAQAEKWNVCPHELQLDLADFADVVICDYNYVFDPNARLKRFFGEGSRKDDYVFLIDEAHNLVERGRDMFSADLTRREFLNMSGEVKKFTGKDRGQAAGASTGMTGKSTGTTGESTGMTGKATGTTGESTGMTGASTGMTGEFRESLAKLRKGIARCSRLMFEMRKNCTQDGTMDFPEVLATALMNLSGAAEDVLTGLKEDPQSEFRQSLLAFYFRITAFLNMSELVDEHYMICQQALPEDVSDYRIRLFCVNPAANLQQCLDRGRSAVFFSATLLPVRYYRSLLSGRTDDYAVYIPSIFPEENRLVVIGRDVSSRYRRRSPEEFRRMALYIREVTSCRRGNYMAFFPSYTLMESVAGAFAELDGAPAILMQKRSMTEADREDFLEKFSRGREDTLVGFCVMGGIFSEGIDLAGDRLIGAVIVGTGIPQVCFEREILKKYYDDRGEDGFGYAYRYPGMNKVLQAAGRVIRTPDDRGVIVLLDDRFTKEEYRGMFPREWERVEAAQVKNVGAIIESFWKSRG